MLGAFVPRSTSTLSPPENIPWMQYPGYKAALSQSYEIKRHRTGDPQAFLESWKQKAVVQSQPDMAEEDRKPLAARVLRRTWTIAQLRQNLLEARGDEDHATAADRAMFDDAENAGALPEVRLGEQPRPPPRRPGSGEASGGRDEEHDSTQPDIQEDDIPVAVPPVEAPQAVGELPQRVAEEMRNEPTEAATPAAAGTLERAQDAPDSRAQMPMRAAGDGLAF